MEHNRKTEVKISGEYALPKELVWTIILLCVLPFLLNIFGLDFGIQKRAFDASSVPGMLPNEVIDSIHCSLSGSFTHTILEWSAFCTAIFTVILAFVHFRIKHDVATPIVGVALFCTGCMDAFHTLALFRLLGQYVGFLMLSS